MEKANKVNVLVGYLTIHSAATTKELKKNHAYTGRGFIRRAIDEGKVVRGEVWEKNFKHDGKGRQTSKGTMHYIYGIAK